MSRPARIVLEVATAVAIVVEVAVIAWGVSDPFLGGLAAFNLVFLASCAGYRFGTSNALRKLKETIAPLPAKVTLTFADNGALTALVQRMDGNLAALTIPEEVAQAGPEASMRWAFEHSLVHE